MQAGGGDEESMGGMGERGVRKGGGIAVGSGGGRKMGGREEMTGGGGEMSVSGGHSRGGAGVMGTEVED